MTIGPCFAKLQRELRDFDTSDVREAAKVYASRGMEDKAANVAAIEDHLRELRQARQRVVDHVLEQWKTRDPEGYANAARPALDLKGETEGEVRAREAQQEKDSEQQRKVANAPSEKGFTLTGSDRPVDEAEARGQKAMFKQGAEEAAKAETSPAGGMKEEDARAALKGAVENTKVPIRVVQSVKDLPFEAPADAKGAFHEGKIWAVADNLSDALDAERTIARHEVTHAGLDILYGDSRAREVALTKVVAANPKIREIARAWREQYGDGIRDQAKAEGMKADAVEREVRLASFEEGLAHFAEGGNEIRGWQQFVAVIQKGLRAMGLDRVADWLEHATNAEALSLLDQARKATREESMPGAGDRLQPAFHRAYHGSPHDFERFDSSKIGTGEGAQAYGHGLYFAGKREVAEHYKETLGRRHSTNVGPYLDPKNDGGKTRASLLKMADVIKARADKIDVFADDATLAGWVGRTAALLRFDRNYHGYFVEAVDRVVMHKMTEAQKGPIENWSVPAEKRAQFIREAVDEVIAKPPARLYEVELAPKEHEYLDWDKGLTQQSDTVKERLRAAGINPEGRVLDNGGDLYKALARDKGSAPKSTFPEWMRDNGITIPDPKAASDYLASIGIPGIKYLDGSSRSKGEGHHNYVIFDDKHVEVRAKFSRKPSEAEEKADVLQLSAARERAQKVEQRQAEPLPEGPLSRIGDALAKTFAPAARGKNAGDMAGIMRSNLAKQARDREIAERQLRGYAKTFDKMPKEQNYAFIDAMESGTKLGDQKLQTAADALRKLLDDRRDQVIALGKGKLENYYENYFPHIWKDPSAAKALFGKFFGKRPLQGSKAFLKQRTFDTFKQGLDAGLDPLTTNPVELALLKAREMDRYIYAQKMFEEMKQSGLAKFVRFGDKSPDAWTKINDSIARVYSPTEQGTVIRGEYYAPEQAGVLINNHLSPGFSGNAFYDAWRGLGNAMNSAQLGLGAFHLGFTSLDAAISRVALGIKQTSRGFLRAEPVEFARGVGTAASGLAPWQAFVNLYKGDKLLKAYLGDMKDPSMAPIVEALVEGGGRARMDPFYRVQEQHNFRQALKLGRYGEVAKSVVPRVMDALNWPIFEYLVPRQKLGVFFDLAKDAIRRNPDMTLEEKRATFGKLWDSVENRMGQMTYDNLFWNRALKDTLMASVRSVGWNLGTFREIGGGVKDLKSTISRRELSDRTAYVIGMVTMTGVLGSMIQYAYTGQGPQSAKDLFFPRTGRKNPDGSEERLSLPSYVKDLFEYLHDATNFAKHGEDPTHTIKNKLHPLLSTLAQIIDNKDFFGGSIRSPGDAAVVQVQDELKYLAKQLTPFGIRNYIQHSKAEHTPPTVAGYLTSGQFYGLGTAPGYIVHTPEEEESIAISRNRDAQVKKFRQEVKDGTPWGEVAKRMQAAGMSNRDIKYVRETSSDTMKPHRIKHYQESQ